jgi:hypothetical protein
MQEVPLNPKSAVENPLHRGAQSFRREDNALLPLSGLRPSEFYDPSLPPQQRIAQRAKRLCSCMLGCLHNSRIVPRGAEPSCDCGIRVECFFPVEELAVQSLSPLYRSGGPDPPRGVFRVRGFSLAALHSPRESARLLRPTAIRARQLRFRAHQCLLPCPENRRL